MDVARPFSGLMPALDSAVLFELSGTNQPRTGREIARRVGRSPNGVRRVLERFVDQGLVERQEAGQAFLYRLNRDHLATPAIEALANLRLQLFDRLRDEIAGWEVPPVHASVFGSTARGDGDAESDIDILIVRPKGVDYEDTTWRDQIDELAEAVYRWTGNHSGIAELSEDDLPRLRKERPPVVEEVSEDAVDLAGETTRQLLRRL